MKNIGSDFPFYHNELTIIVCLEFLRPNTILMQKINYSAKRALANVQSKRESIQNLRLIFCSIKDLQKHRTYDHDKLGKFAIQNVQVGRMNFWRIYPQVKFRPQINRWLFCTLKCKGS